MTELQFRKKIKEASKLLGAESYYFPSTLRYGVCDVISRTCDPFLSYYDDKESMASLFGETFVPFRNRKAYWLGSLNKENLENRRLFLNLFEEYMIVNQYYLAY